MNENLKSVLGSINKTPSRNSKLSDDLEKVKSHLKDVHQHINQFESKQKNQDIFHQDDDQFNDVDENVESVHEKLSSYRRSKTNQSYQYEQFKATNHEKTNSEIINQIKQSQFQDQQTKQIQSEKPYKKQDSNNQTFIDKKSQQQQYYFENLEYLNNKNNEVNNPQIQYGFHQQSQSESVRKLNQKVDQIMSQQKGNENMIYQENYQQYQKDKRNSLQHNKCIMEVPEGEQDHFQRYENYSPTINSIEVSPQKQQDQNVNMFHLQDRNIQINVNSQNTQMPPYNIYNLKNLRKFQKENYQGPQLKKVYVQSNKPQQSQNLNIYEQALSQLENTKYLILNKQLDIQNQNDQQDQFKNLIIQQQSEIFYNCSLNIFNFYQKENQISLKQYLYICGKVQFLPNWNPQDEYQICIREFKQKCTNTNNCLNFQQFTKLMLQMFSNGYQNQCFKVQVERNQYIDYQIQESHFLQQFEYQNFNIFDHFQSDNVDLLHFFKKNNSIFKRNFDKYAFIDFKISKEKIMKFNDVIKIFNEKYFIPLYCNNKLVEKFLLLIRLLIMEHLSRQQQFQFYFVFLQYLDNKLNDIQEQYTVLLKHIMQCFGKDDKIQ